MLGPLELQPSELMKISLVLALARFLHGKSVEEVSKPLNLGIALAMIGVPAVFVVMRAQSGHHPDHRDGWLLAAVPGGPVLVLDRRRAERDRRGRAAGLALCAARLPEGAGDDLPQSGIRRAGRGLEHHPGQDRHRLGRAGRQGLPAGHAEPAQLPARKADRFHLDQLRARNSALSARSRCWCCSPS